MGKLSNVQNTRLGGLIAVLSGREPYAHILDSLVSEGFVKSNGGSFALTEKGMREKDRLATLAGLMVEKDYAAPLPRPSMATASHTSHTPTHDKDASSQNITQGQPSFDTKSIS